MRLQTMNGLQVLRRLLEFLLTASPLTTLLGSVAKHVEMLGEIVDRLAAHAVEQEQSARGFQASAAVAQALAQSLRVELMRPIARMAQTLFPDDPDLRHSLVLPRSTSYEKTIAGALALAGRVDEHKDRFIAVGFSPDFVDRLRKGVVDLRAQLDLKGQHYGKRSASSAGLLDELGRARDLVRMLDDMVSAGLKATPDRLAEWRTLSRFARRAKVEAADAPATGTPNVPPSGTPPVTPVVPAPVVALPVTAQEQGLVERDLAA